MPRIFKGTETLLKLFVPRVDEGNLETLKIGLFTDDTNNAVEFYGDNMSIDGDTVYLKVNAWSFDMMNDGVLNYIAEIEIGEETIITERQSNYYLKTPNQYVPVGPDLSDYYTKPEIDEMLENIEVDVDLTGYATEQYVNDAIANIDIPEGGDSKIITYQMGTDWSLEEAYNNFHNGYMIHLINDDGRIGIVTDSSNNNMIRLNGFLGDLNGDVKPLRFECNNNNYLYTWKLAFNEDITRIDSILNSGGSGDDSVVFEVVGDNPTIEQFNEAKSLFNQGKRVVFKKDDVIYTVIGITGNYMQVIFSDRFTTYINTMSISGGVACGFEQNHILCYNGKPFDEKYTIYNFPNLAMYSNPYNVKDLTHAIKYKDWYISANVNPDTLDVSCILGDKIYIWNKDNGAKDENGYTIPRIIDLANQGGSSSGADLSNYYTKEETDNLIANSGGGSGTIIVEGSDYYTINPSPFEEAYNNNIPAFYKDTESFFPVIITKNKSEKFEAYCILENKQLVRWKWSSGVVSTSATIEDIVDNNSVKYVSITKFNKLLYADVEDAYTNGKILYVRLRTTTTKPYNYTTIPFSIIRDEGNLNYQIFGVYNYNPFSIISATIADGEANFSDYTITEVSGGSGGGDYGDYISCSNIDCSGTATFGAEVYFNNSGESSMVDTANGIATAYKTARTMVNDTWVDNIHIGNRYDGNNRINFTTTYYNVPENTTESERIVAAIDDEGNFYEGETKLSDKYALKSEISATIQRISGESLNGEEVYNLWQNNIPIWMDYQGYDRDNGDIYTAYAPLHIYKPLASGTELKVYLWMTPNIYVEWQLDINDNDDVHGLIIYKE